MLEECPKCHRTGLQPVYHKKDDPKCITGTFINIVDWEHLHYVCKCGYDFIKNTKEGEDA